MPLRPDLAVPGDDNTADDFAAQKAAEAKRAGIAALVARARSEVAASKQQQEESVPAAEAPAAEEPGAAPVTAADALGPLPSGPGSTPTPKTLAAAAASAPPDKEWWDTMDVVKQSMRGGAEGILEIAKTGTELGSAIGVPGAETLDQGLADQLKMQKDFWGEATSTAGGFAKPIAQFGAGALVLGPAGRAIGLAKKLEAASGLTKALIGGTATGALAFDPHERRLSNTLKDRHIGGAVVDWLAANEDDSALEARLKNAAEAAATGGALYGVGKVGIGIAKAVAKSERMRYFFSKAFSVDPPSQEIQQVVEDIGAARGAISDIKEKIGSHSEESVPALAQDVPAAAAAESPELTKLKTAKAEMKSVRDDRLAKFEVLKGTYEYKRLSRATKEKLEAAAAGRRPALPRDTRVAMEDELGRRAVGVVARDVKKWAAKAAVQGTLIDDAARSEETQRILANAFNLDTMPLNTPGGQKALGEVMRAVAPIWHKISPEIPAGKFSDEANKAASALFGKQPAEFLRNLTHVAGYSKDLGPMIAVGREFATYFSKQLGAMAKEYVKVGGPLNEEMRAKMVQMSENASAFAVPTKGLQRNVARALYTLRKDVDTGKLVGYINPDLLDQAISSKFLSNANAERVLREIALAGNDGAAAINALKRAKHPVMSAVREYYTNSLLSGLISSTVNATGNTMKMLWDPVDQGAEQFWRRIGEGANVGTAFGEAAGEMKAVYGAFLETSSLFVRSMGGFLELPPSAYAIDIGEARRALNPQMLSSNARAAFRESRPVLAGGGFSAEANLRRPAITGEALFGDRTQARLGDLATTYLKTGTDWMGTAIRMPTRAMTTVDEVFTGMNFFMHARREAYRLGRQDGLRGDTLRKYMDTFVEKMDDETLTGVFERSVDSAKRNVWQDELGDTGKWIQRGIEEHPGASLVIPFFKTPVNILKYTLKHHPGYQLLELAFNKDKALSQFVLGSGEARRAFLRTKAGADMAGRFTTSAMFTGAAALTIDPSWITGRAPSDLKAREAWEATGRTEYSIRIFDTWYSYGRLDPFGMLLGTYANFFLYGPPGLGGGRASDDDVQSHELGFLNMISSTAQMIDSRNYLQGVAMLFKVLHDVPAGDYSSIGKFVTQTAGGFVPNIISQFKGRLDFGILDSSPVRRDATEYDKDGRIDILRTFSNSLATRAGSDLAPRKWTAFGPSVRQSGVGWDLVSPVAGSVARNSKFASALARAGSSPVFTDQQRKYMDFPIPFGHRDRMGELMSTLRLHGKTIAEKGEEIASDPRFAAMPDAESGDRFKSKRDVLNKLTLSYQKAAFGQLVKEYPDVAKQFAEFRVRQRTPAAVEALLGSSTNNNTTNPGAPK